MAQIAQLLSDGTSIELLDGERRRKVSPQSPHSIVQGALFALLQDRGRGIGLAGTEWDFRLGMVDGSVSLLVPDVAFLSFERLSSLPMHERMRPPIAPDIAVEVWSPSNERAFVDGKIRKYLACGSSLVLDVDPRTRTIAAYSKGDVTTFERDQNFESDALSWLRFPVADAFIGAEYFE